MVSTEQILKNAKQAEKLMRGVSEELINKALLAMADALIECTDTILLANEDDCQSAEGRISPVMIDRLRLNEKRISDMAEGIRAIAALPYPIGQESDRTVTDRGLIIKKVTVPMGVIAIIYESRPNVTSDAAALALKSGNVCILRGGKEAYRTSRAITDTLVKAIVGVGLPQYAVQLVDDTARASAVALMKARGYVDLLIPRGGAGLISACVENATVPCLETGTGICHIYVDKDADIDKALAIVENAKCSRPSVCNAMEVCLVHKDIAETFLPRMKKLLTDDRSSKGLTPVELRLDEGAKRYIDGVTATDTDYDTEFLDYILAVKLVGSVDEAIEHIEAHSTRHSDAIVTECGETAERFVGMVDSAAVYINASTRFTDGGEFGLGCEMGISTQKMHARGPMGIKELTTYKYVICGNGHTR